MPRRISARTVSSSATPQAPAPPQQPETPYDFNIRQLRHHWKWAAFSQFFFTFSPLLAMADVTLVDVENDLVHSTNRVLPRIMQRLLITLTQDRKITTDSWQNTLRRQYQRRDPDASPIGLVARSQHVESSRASTAPLAAISEEPLGERECHDDPLAHDQSLTPLTPDNEPTVESVSEDPGYLSITKTEEEDASSEVLEKQVDWLDLSMLAKLDSLHVLAEWQFQNPHRLRQQMKTDDEQATWRIEPIGYDAKRNAYWLIGGDRLWIQREPPRLNLKRKRKPGGNNTKKQSQHSTAKRQRTNPSSGSAGQSYVTRPTRGRAHPQSSPVRESRIAKTRANQKLDAQAKDLAEFRRQMGSSHLTATSGTSRRPVGIRVSARLRGTAVEEDEWQEVPEEWLAMSNTRRGGAKNPLPSPLSPGGKKFTAGLESDISSISELTELSDGEDNGVTGPEHDFDEPVTDVEKTNRTWADEDVIVKSEDQQDAETKSTDSPVTLPYLDDFVEWETICVTLEEWECIGKQFEKATHYAEKALYKVLTQSIVPMVTAELREVERKRRMEDAVVHRKRSSRIAMKEIEKEEERAATRKRLEVEEKMSRARRLEARQQREQMERLKRENAREQRRKERDLREQQSDGVCEDSKADGSVDDVQDGAGSNSLVTGPAETHVARSAVPINGTGSGSRSPVENWELDCEICGRKGLNQDDGVPLLCCGVCAKWQHIVCHDNQDSMAGRPKRNWDTAEFICRQCNLRTSGMSTSGSSAAFHSVGVNGKTGQASGGQAYYGQPSNYPRSYNRTGHYQSSPSDPRYPYERSDVQAATPSPSSRSYNSHSTGVTFAHYQPQQGGFSTSRPTYSVQDVSSPLHSRYTLAPNAASPAGTTSCPSTFHAQPITRSPTHAHEQRLSPSSYPRTTNSYPINAQGAQPYYNGHVQASYSHMRGTTNSTVLGQYAGLQHVPSYQHSK